MNVDDYFKQVMHDSRYDIQLLNQRHAERVTTMCNRWHTEGEAMVSVGFMYGQFLIDMAQDQLNRR